MSYIWWETQEHFVVVDKMQTVCILEYSLSLAAGGWGSVLWWKQAEAMDSHSLSISLFSSH